MIAGIQSSRVLGAFAASLEGLQGSRRKLEGHAEGVARGDLSPENVVGQIEAIAGFKANAVMIRATDEMIGTLLDTFA